MLGAVMPEVFSMVEAEHDTAVGQQARVLNVGKIRPAGRAIGCYGRFGPDPPGGSPERDETGRDAAHCSDQTGPIEDAGRFGPVGQPPGEEFPKGVERDTGERTDWQPKCGLTPRASSCRRLRRAQRHDREQERSDNLNENEPRGWHR